MRGWLLPVRVFFARLFRRITGKSPGYFRIGKCRRCGACCRDVVLNYKGRKITSDEELSRLLSEDSDYEIFSLKTVARDGTYIFQCTMLDEHNRCMTYHHRPGVCGDYPDPDLLRCGTDVIEECGYYLVPPEDFRLP